MSAVTAFAVADLRALRRDPLLRMLMVAPLAMVGVLVIGVPLIEGWLADAYAFDLVPHRPLSIAFIACVTMPTFFGAMGGLLVLEDRESGVLPAIAVSPAGLRSYLVVRCAWAGTAALVTIAGALVLHGGTPVPALLLAAALGGGCAVVVLLLVGSLAGDRLEGMAVVKALTLPLALVLLVQVVDAPWSWLLAVLPSYGPAVALFDGLDARPLAPIAVFGAVQLGLWTALLVRRLVRRVS